MPRLSILIPCLGDAGEFEDTLVSVLQNRPADSEVLVAHARPYDDPYKLQGEVCFVYAPEAREIVQLLNAGFDATRAGVIHVVQCGLRVEDGWVESALSHFQDDSVAAVSPALLDSKRNERLLAAGRDYSASGRAWLAAYGQRVDKSPSREPVAPTLLAGFYRRSWWRLLRWDESLGDDFADVQLGLSLATLGARIEYEPLSRLYANRALADRYNACLGFRSACRAERLFKRNRSPDAGRWPLVSHAIACAVECIGALPSPKSLSGLLGRLYGRFEKEDRAAYLAKLEEIRVRLEREADEATIRVPFERSASPVRTVKRAA